MNGTPDLMITLPGVPESVSVARRSVRSVLRTYVPTAAVDDCCLVTSELATLAVLHGGDSFTVRAWVRAFAGWLRVEVDDAGRTTASPIGTRAGPDGEDDPTQGAGLMVVAKVARDMGHEISPDGTQLWAEIHWPVD